jgi:hypothetical protein
MNGLGSALARAAGGGVWCAAASPAATFKFEWRMRVITEFDGLLCKLAEGFLASTPRANRSVGGSPPGLTPV